MAGATSTIDWLHSSNGTVRHTGPICIGSPDKCPRSFRLFIMRVSARLPGLLWNADRTAAQLRGPSDRKYTSPCRRCTC
jgi:hypothetical protein